MTVSLAQLRAARAMLGWTADDLGQRSGVHRHTVRKLELGKAAPQRGTVSRIIAALEAGGVKFVGEGVQPRKLQNGISRPVRGPIHAQVHAHARGGEGELR